VIFNGIVGEDVGESDGVNVGEKKNMPPTKLWFQKKRKNKKTITFE